MKMVSGSGVELTKADFEGLPGETNMLVDFIRATQARLVELRPKDAMGSKATYRKTFEEMNRLTRKMEAAKYRLRELQKNAPPTKLFDVLKVDRRAADGRIYPRKVLERELLKYQHAIAHSTAFGPVTTEGRVAMSEVSFIVREARLELDTLKVRIAPAPTDLGASLPDNYDKVSVQLVGMGSMDDQGSVGEDYHLIGFKLVPRADA